MFSDELLTIIFSDGRLCNIPLEFQSTVVHVVEDAMQKRFYTDNLELSKEQILDDVCGG